MHDSKWIKLTDKLPKDLWPVLVAASDTEGKGHYCFVALLNHNDMTWDSMFPRDDGPIGKRDKLSYDIKPYKWREIPDC